MIPENAGQFTDNKQIKRVERYDRLNPEWIWYYTCNNMYNNRAALTIISDVKLFSASKWCRQIYKRIDRRDTTK